MTTTEQLQSSQLLDKSIYTVFIDGNSNLGFFEDDNLVGPDAEQASAAEVDTQPNWKEEYLEEGDFLNLSDGIYKVDGQLNLVDPNKEDDNKQQQEQGQKTGGASNTVKEPVYAIFKDNDGKLDFVDNPDAIYMAGKDEIDSQPDWKKKNLTPGQHLDLKEGVYKVDDKLNLFNPTKNNAFLIEDGMVWYEPKSSSGEETKEEEQQNDDENIAEPIKKFLPLPFPALTGIPKKQIFLGVATLISTIIIARILFAVLGAVASLPFLPTFFEMVGMSYTLWFFYRYLSTVEGREELQSKWISLRDRVVTS